MKQPWARALLAFALLVLALNVAVIAVDAILPSPGGPDSSSYATRSRGLAAWADLARRQGVTVRALRRAPSDATLPRSGTVVVLEPHAVTPGEAAALRRFASRGGTVVAGGRDPGLWMGELLGQPLPPDWHADGPVRAGALVPVTETRGVSVVRSAGEGRWGDLGPALPLVGAGGRTILATASAGEGRIVMVADASPLQNRLLGQADNAALALALSARGPLTFVESVHGYGEGRGLAALPRNIGWALILLGVAALALLASRGRRFGPPESPHRALPPPRAAYVDALAATLSRGRRS